MAKNEPPKNIGELIDSIDLIREELHKLQRSMERMEFHKIPERVPSTPSK
jgi:hypothetical protein